MAVWLLVACGPDRPPRGASGPADCKDDAGPYFLYDDPAWEFREAVDYPGELSGPRGGSGIDWYAEYERLTPIPGGTRGDSLALAGRRVAIDAYRGELQGWDPQERTIQGLRGLAAPAPGGTPTIVAIAVEDNYTMDLVSYGLDIDELIGVARAIDRVCQPDWLSSGGRLAECLPTDGACLASTTTTTTSSAPPPQAPLSTDTTSGP